MFNDEETWDESDNVRNETSGGQFVRLKAGDTVYLVFPVAPFSYRSVWLGDHSEVYDPDKHDGVSPRGRHAFPVFEPVPGKAEYTPKIFDVSNELYDQIKKVRSKKGSRVLYEIEREGSTMNDTKYTILPQRELKDKEVEYLRGLEPLDAEQITLHGGGDDDDQDTSSESAAAPVGSDPWG